MNKVLVVDDTKNIRILLSKTLEIEGFEVITAKDAFEALSLFKKEVFDICFIDIKMPGMSGITLLEELEKFNLSCKIIVMTAFGTIKNAIKSTKLGASSYLQKPFSASTIKKTLEEVLENSLTISNSNEILLEDKIKKILLENPLNSESYLKISILLEKENIELSSVFLEFSQNLNKLKR